MVEVTDNAIAVNQQIFDELVGHHDAPKAMWTMNINRPSEIINHMAYDKYNAQIDVMIRVCRNLGIELKIKEIK